MYESFFQICCYLTDICSHYLGITYGEFNVLAFLHIQPITYILSNLLIVLITFSNRIKINKFEKILFLLLSVLSIVYYIYLFNVYPVSNDSFYKSYNDLHQYANLLSISYIDINFLLFIGLFIYVHLRNMLFIIIKKTD